MYEMNVLNNYKKYNPTFDSRFLFKFLNTYLSKNMDYVIIENIYELPQKIKYVEIQNKKCPDCPSTNIKKCKSCSDNSHKYMELISLMNDKINAINKIIK